MAGIMTVSSVFVSTPKVIYADNAAAANVVTEIPGTVSTESSYNSSFLSITGFASVNGNVHDRSEYVGTEYYRVIDDETVDIYLVNPKAPCFIRDKEENYIYLILPVNFSA